MAVDIHPLSELMKRKPREVLVANLLFAKGITTLVAPSGDGKTTTGASIALLTAAGGIWDGKKIEPRPVLWIAGEGEDDLPPMVQAGAKDHGLEWEKLPISICFEAVDFSSIIETNHLIEKLKGMPPMLIIADALADIIGDLSEDKSKDITQVYKNLRLVEKKTGSVILVLHHQGWNSDRERGSTAIRAKSDIMVQIAEFKPDDGYIKLTHLKRRGGPKVKEFTYEVKLVPVEGCEHDVPIVTGVDATASMLLNEDLAANEEHARDLVQIVATQSQSPVAWSDLKELSGKPKSTFKRGLDEAVKVKGWLLWGKGGYALNPDGSWEAALVVQDEVQVQGPRVHPYRGVDPLDPVGERSMDPTGPSLDPGPYAGEEPPSKPHVNEVELEKAAALLKKVVP
jgi:hypothetical protein